MRLLPDRSFPPYAYLPGDHPHPTKDPAGHSFGASEDDPLAFEWGVDLYHHGYFWEAHEAWEPLWRASEGDERALLAGLIQCAAACLKLRVGEQRGARRLSERALGHLRRVDGATHGVRVGVFAASFAAWMATEPTEVEGRPRIVMG